MKLDLEPIRSSLDGFNSIARIAKETRDLRLDSVELNFSGCRFFEANMAAPLYVVVARLRDELNDVSVRKVSSEIEGMLKRNRFLTVFNMTSLNDDNQTTLPFKTF